MHCMHLSQNDQSGLLGLQTNSSYLCACFFSSFLLWYFKNIPIWWHSVLQIPLRSSSTCPDKRTDLELQLASSQFNRMQTQKRIWHVWCWTNEGFCQGVSLIIQISRDSCNETRILSNELQRLMPRIYNKKLLVSGVPHATFSNCYFLFLCYIKTTECRTDRRGGGGALPLLTVMGKCRWTGYDFPVINIDTAYLNRPNSLLVGYSVYQRIASQPTMFMTGPRSWHQRRCVQDATVQISRFFPLYGKTTIGQSIRVVQYCNRVCIYKCLVRCIVTGCIFCATSAWRQGQFLTRPPPSSGEQMI